MTPDERTRLRFAEAVRKLQYLASDTVNAAYRAHMPADVKAEASNIETLALKLAERMKE